MRPVIVNYNKDNRHGVGVHWWPDEKITPVAVAEVQVRLFLRLNEGPWVPWPGEEAPQVDVGWMRRSTAVDIIRHLKRDGATYRVEQRRRFSWVVACPWCNARACRWDFDCDGPYLEATCGSAQCGGPSGTFDTGDEVWMTIDGARVNGVVDYPRGEEVRVRWPDGCVAWVDRMDLRWV